jgi:uncharacterized repeat protein (TIGR03803 family)
MKTFRTAASLLVFGALIIATSVDMSATPRFGVDVVHSFAGSADGSQPAAGLVQATDGNFYGTTYFGGASNAGSVFKMTPTGVTTIVHSFTAGLDGGYPLAGLIQATDGKLYGTASQGGSLGLGTVYSITLAGAFTTVYSFTGPASGGPDGANHAAALLQTSDGFLYGTTYDGGSSGRGTIFVMNTAGTVLGRYSFTGGFDGANPYAPLIEAADHTLYGTNYAGTTLTFGRVFKLAGGVVSVVHTFAGGASDGASPTAPLVQANDGNFYGTTRFGGASNKGTAFRMTPGGVVTVLNSFSGGADGEAPFAGLIQASDGNLYGTTKVGALGYGTIYKVTLGGTFTVVHTFTGGAEGAVPSAPLMQATTGRLYGTASFGGASSLGVVFRIPAAAAGDFDGDGKSDVTVYTPSIGTWSILNSSDGTGHAVAWGASTDKVVAGDYDGDGKMDPAVFRPSTGQWFILKSGANYGSSIVATWGVSSDIPVPADYDGDGKTDIAVYRPSTGQWFILTSSSNYLGSIIFTWGTSTDVPVPGDYDGDGKADPAVYRPSTGQWIVLKSSANYTTNIVQAWGASTDIPVPGDYDGDGMIDLAVFRPSTGQWIVLMSSTNYTTNLVQAWGVSSDILVPADYDGDGRTDLAVFRAGTWFILKSSSGYTKSTSFTWGGSGDTPINKRP